MKISLASPVYNESSLIQRFIHEAVHSLQQISNDIEIVLVNDCSTDDTLLKIREILPQYTCIKLINLTRNSGQHIASSIALQHTSGDYIFMMDSDMQVSPKHMIELFDHGRHIQNWDIVSASRVTRSSNVLRRIGSNVVSKILQISCKTKLKDIGSTFKLIKRRALDKLLSQDILIQNLPILMMNLALTIVEYPIEYGIIQDRKSHYKFIDLLFAIILAFLNFTTGSWTLVFLAIMGSCLTSIGIIGVSGIIIWGIVQQAALPTNLLIFALIISVVGIQFILLSMIVFKIERINKNLDFRRSINQRIEYEN